MQVLQDLLKLLFFNILQEKTSKNQPKTKSAAPAAAVLAKSEKEFFGHASDRFPPGYDGRTGRTGDVQTQINVNNSNNR